ncbi:MAG: hypothetical protein ACE5HS_23020 [bacterium]
MRSDAGSTAPHKRQTNQLSQKHPLTHRGTRAFFVCQQKDKELWPKRKQKFQFSNFKNVGFDQEAQAIVTQNYYFFLYHTINGVLLLRPLGPGGKIQLDSRAGHGQIQI